MKQRRPNRVRATAIALAIAWTTHAGADRLLEGLPSFDVGRAPSAIVAGDFTGDGFDDVVVANVDDATVSVLPGTGRGHFLAQRVTPVAAGPTALAVIDVDNDGARDLLVAHESGGTITVLRNDGAGTLAEHATLAPGGTPTSLATGHFNADGRPDFIVSRAALNDVALYLSDGASGFLAPTAIPVGVPASQVLALDVDGDTDLDLVAPHNADAFFTVTLNNAGTFAAPVPYGTHGAGTSLAAGDTNGDARPDLVIVSVARRTAALHLNLGGGAFGVHTIYSLGTSPGAIVATELGGAAGADFLVTCHSGGGIQSFPEGAVLLRANGDGTLASRSFGTPGRPDALAVLDANDDGAADIALVGASDSVVTLALGDGAGRVATYVLAMIPSPYGWGGGLDFDGDGAGELVTTNGHEPGGFTIWHGDANGVFAPHASFSTGTYFLLILAGDLNNDGLDDLVAVADNAAIHQFTNRGDGTFEDIVLPGFQSLPRRGRLVDLNSDGFRDLILVGAGTGSRLWLNDGAGLLGEPWSGFAAGGYDMDVWDVDGVAGPDVVITLAPIGTSVHYNTGAVDQPFGNVTSLPVIGFHIAPTDVDRDGDIDIVGAMQFAAQDWRLYRQYRGPSGFAPHEILGPLPNTSLGAVAEDVDGDGWDDILILNSALTDSYIFRNNAGAIDLTPESIASSTHINHALPVRLGTSPATGFVIFYVGDAGPTFWVRFLQNSTPWVERVEAMGPRTIDVHFSEPMAGAVLDPAAYTVSGAGQGTLAPHPDAVSGLTHYAVRLTWEAGEVAGGLPASVAVARAVTDLRGNPIGFQVSGDGGIPRDPPASPGLTLR